MHFCSLRIVLLGSILPVALSFAPAPPRGTVAASALPLARAIPGSRRRSLPPLGGSPPRPAPPISEGFVRTETAPGCTLTCSGTGSGAPLPLPDPDAGSRLAAAERSRALRVPEPVPRAALVRLDESCWETWGGERGGGVRVLIFSAALRRVLTTRGASQRG